MTARPASAFVPPFLRVRAVATGSAASATIHIEPWYPPPVRDPFEVFTDKVRRHLSQLDIYATGFRRSTGFWEIEVRCEGKPRWWYRLSDVLKDPPSYRTADA